MKMAAPLKRLRRELLLAAPDDQVSLVRVLELVVVLLHIPGVLGDVVLGVEGEHEVLSLPVIKALLVS